MKQRTAAVSDSPLVADGAVGTARSLFHSLMIWLRYLVVWPSIPPQGNPAHASDIVALAFGRNQFRDEALREVASLVSEAESDTHAMLLLARKGFDPGRPNRSLAGELKHALESTGGHVAATVQWEIAFALYEEWPLYWKAHSARLRVVWPRLDGNLLSTEDVLLDAARNMSPEREHQVLLLAHRRHMPRTLLLWRRIAQTAKYAGLAKGIIITGQPTWLFDEHSVQRQTTSPAAWIIRESLVRVHHILTRRT